MYFPISLSWLDFSVNLASVETWLKANAGDQYVSSVACDRLILYFNQDPGQDVTDAINAYWAGLTNQSVEATSYVSAADEKAAKDSARQAAIASGTSKLEALGLTADEIAAFLGQ